MAFRGCGRGLGRGRGSIFETQLGKHVPYDDFPDDVELPSLPHIKVFPDLKASRVNLERFWRGSCYYSEDPIANSKNQETEVERFSDRFKDKTQGRRRALASFLTLTSSNFPPELIHGSKRVQHENKKLRLDNDSDAKLLDVFEKLEEETRAKVTKAKVTKSLRRRKMKMKKRKMQKRRKPVRKMMMIIIRRSALLQLSLQNIDFDDDEDDLNMEEEGNEDVYE